ncbi:hypothetical protein MAM1_0039c02809 [Mucor ambiguus]|uniref:Uncharacterized protein n=1 Tax=Mucor ambiguus TaxID=91626 RepID=A0A0C9M380_9FUNG|nr:hypothetical protein MAM1_0039c02809 [Mucor ambiguus]
MVDYWCCLLGVSVLFAAVAVHLLLHLRCSLLVLAIATSTVVHLLFWRCSLLVLDFAVCCCSLAVLVLPTAAAAAAAAVHILSLS